jgi:tripartite-type tricarboxylate transporter receptor subunit TctC
LLGGQIAAFCGPVGDFLQHVKTGRLRLLAVSAQQRSPYVPEVSTLKEQGLPIAVREWYGFFMPANVRADVVERSSAAINKALQAADVETTAQTFALELSGSGPKVLGDLLQADARQWQGLIKELNFTADS